MFGFFNVKTKKHVSAAKFMSGKQMFFDFGQNYKFVSATLFTVRFKLANILLIVKESPGIDEKN